MTLTALQRKQCLDCGRELSVSKFGMDKSTRDGLHIHCRGCRSRYQKEYRKTNHGREMRHRAEEKYRNSEHGREVCRQKNINYRNTIGGHLRQVFAGIKYRCCNPSCTAFKNYGGRGIQNKFKSVDGFIEYVTSVLKIDPCGLDIDRIDNDGHYERGNIRFVTRKENMNNRRK